MIAVHGFVGPFRAVHQGSIPESVSNSSYHCQTLLNDVMCSFDVQIFHTSYDGRPSVRPPMPNASMSDFKRRKEKKAHMCKAPSLRPNQTKGPSC